MVEYLSNLYLRHIISPWDIVRTRFTDKLQRLRRRYGKFSESKMFQDEPDDKRIIDDFNDTNDAILREY